LEIGHPSTTPMDNADTSILGRPAGIEVDEKAHEVYIADGYLNRRVIVFDSQTGAFKRMWGAYGNPPSNANSHRTIPPIRLVSSSGIQSMRTCVARWICLRLRSSQQPNSGFYERRQVCKGNLHAQGNDGQGSAYDLAFSL